MELPTLEKTYYNTDESNFWTKLFLNVSKSFDPKNNHNFLKQIERICDMLMMGPFSSEAEIIFNEAIANVNVGIKVLLEDDTTRTLFIRTLKKEYFQIYKNVNIQLPSFIKKYFNLYPDIE
jgi:hypothetical protein